VQQTVGQALSQASGVADDVLAAGRHAPQTASRQVNEQPLMVVIAGFALGYVAAFYCTDADNIGHRHSSKLCALSPRESGLRIELRCY
jgi:hypothetical protein